MYDEKNTGTNLPGRDRDRSGRRRRLQVAVHGQGRRLGEQEPAVPGDEGAAQPRQSLMRWLDEKLRTLGTAACPPYHLALVIGGTSAEFTLKTAKLASARYLDTLPRDRQRARPRLPRRRARSSRCCSSRRQFGIGAQFGGKYFCHDVRVIRLPRHGASCPVALAVSCSADRQALGKITADGVFLEQLETDPAKYLPDVTDDELEGGRRSRSTSTSRWARSAGRCRSYPVKTRVMLTGPMVVARDIAHAKLKERLDAGEGLPQYLQRLLRLLRRARPRRPTGYASGSFGPTTAGRMDSYVDLFQAARRFARDARQGQPLEGRHRRVQARTAASTSARSAARRRGSPRTASPRSRCSSTRSSAWKRCGRSRSATSPRSSSSTTRATTSSPTSRSPPRSADACSHLADERRAEDARHHRLAGSPCGGAHRVGGARRARPRAR